jgi:hypothetical protein
VQAYPTASFSARGDPRASWTGGVHFPEYLIRKDLVGQPARLPGRTYRRIWGAEGAPCARPTTLLRVAKIAGWGAGTTEPPEWTPT